MWLEQSGVGYCGVGRLVLVDAAKRLGGAGMEEIQGQ